MVFVYTRSGAVEKKESIRIQSLGDGKRKEGGSKETRSKQSYIYIYLSNMCRYIGWKNWPCASISMHRLVTIGARPAYIYIALLTFPGASYIVLLFGSRPV